MPFKPCSDDTKHKLEALIRRKEKEIALSQSCITTCQEQLAQGEWRSDIDYASLPMPEPSCYLCIYHIPILDRCKKDRQYGSVCSDYQHFSGRVRC